MPDDQQIAPAAVRFDAITKRFGTVLANDAVSFSVKAGEIHGIVGENGAGKSTLMSILYGFYQGDEGRIFLHGQAAQIRNSTDAIGLGIGMVHQHFMLVDTLTGLENVLLGVEGGVFISGGLARARARLEKLMREFMLPVRLDALVQDMTVGEQQRLEILKTLYREARILILDEPTGVLTPQEVGELFAVLRQLRSHGVTVLIITHKLQEIMAITDTVTVMRAGRVVAERETAATDRAELAQLMIGRPVTLQFPKRELGDGLPVRLRVDGLGYVDARGVRRLSNIGFELRAGEILGIAGVSGNGQTELQAILTGLLAPTEGRMQWVTDAGEHAFEASRWMSARELRPIGGAHIPEDRLRDGLVKNFSLQETAILGRHDDAGLGIAAWLSPARVRDRAMALIERFGVRPPLPGLRTANLSGGNQQRLVIAREMAPRPQVLIVGQPTRGVDLGAIERIYRELIQARDEGAAILLVSVELEELFALSDRMLVMNAGVITGCVRTEQTTPAEIGLLMTAQAASHAHRETTGTTA